MRFYYMYYDKEIVEMKACKIVKNKKGSSKMF